MEITAFMEINLFIITVLVICIFVMVLYQIIERKRHPIVKAIEGCILHDLDLQRIDALIKSSERKGSRDRGAKAILTARMVAKNIAIETKIAEEKKIAEETKIAEEKKTKQK